MRAVELEERTDLEMLPAQKPGARKASDILRCESVVVDFDGFRRFRA